MVIFNGNTFVMNSVDEINQAVEDFNAGKFDELID